MPSQITMALLSLPNNPLGFFIKPSNVWHLYILIWKSSRLSLLFSFLIEVMVGLSFLYAFGRYVVLFQLIYFSCINPILCSILSYNIVKVKGQTTFTNKNTCCICFSVNVSILYNVSHELFVECSLQS